MADWGIRPRVPTRAQKGSPGLASGASQPAKELKEKRIWGMMRGEYEGHLGDTVPNWGAVVNGAPGALQSRDPGLSAGRRSPASIQINSRQALAVQGLGERSDIFCEDTVSQKIRRFRACFYASGNRP